MYVCIDDCTHMCIHQYFTKTLGLTCPLPLYILFAQLSARVTLILPSWSSKVLLVLEDPDEMLEEGFVYDRRVLCI